MEDNILNFEKTTTKQMFDVNSRKAVEVPTEHNDIVKFIHESPSIKPPYLYMSDTKWKQLVRCVVRAENIMLTGPAGSAKTLAAKVVQDVMGRPSFYVNLGATQDPRSTLIGNTHFNKDNGTYFAKSYFINAITTKNAIILLDELTRAHPDAWNILITVLDVNQRYLRLDEKDDCETIKVADGVTFISTANIGNEYTATRTMDRALTDRFTMIEIDTLDVEQETSLLKYLYPNAPADLLERVSKIAYDTRQEVLNEDPKISTCLSTRTSVQIAGLIYDGFTLNEAAEVSIYPFFTKDGGSDSERAHVKKIVQKHLPLEPRKTTKTTAEVPGGDLFSQEEISSALPT